jgi:hypothetical protein
MASDLRDTPWLLPALAVWLATMGTVALIGTHRQPSAGTRYDPASRRFFLPGSAAALFTVLAIFMLKYGVGVELAMQPALRHSASFTLTLAAVYGVLNGLFSWRPMALWRLAHKASAA